jgi:hypothetical protein
MVPVPSVQEIRQSLFRIEEQLASVKRDSPRLQSRLASLGARRTDIEEQLRTVQRDLATRIQDNERLRIQQETFTEQARVSGRIAYYLENVKAIASDSRLPQAIERLRAEIAEFEQALDDDSLQGRLDVPSEMAGVLADHLDSVIKMQDIGIRMLATAGPRKHTRDEAVAETFALDRRLQ